MKKVLFDTNIILDIALKREPFYEAARMHPDSYRECGNEGEYNY